MRVATLTKAMHIMKRKQIVDTIIEQDGKILMLRRGFEPGKGKLDFLGGVVDEGEIIEQAARREAKEESGFDVELVEKLGEFDFFEREEKTTHVFIGKIVSGRLRASVEGEPIWVDAASIKEEELAFPQFQVAVLAAWKKR